MSSLFLYPNNDYKRGINPIRQYFEQAAQFLSIKHNQPYEECLSWVKEQVTPAKEGETKPLAMINPKVTYIAKDDVGDRQIFNTTLSKYISDSLRNRELIAPTFTTYLHPDEKESYLTGYIDYNVAARSKAKKEMFHAEKEKELDPTNEYWKLQYSIKQNEQQNAKINNNAISGAGVTASTPLYNKTMHSTLTSNCRCTSGYANANNEKLLAGNRHYHRPDIVLNNIVSVITNVDYTAIEAVVQRYNWYIPTVDDVMDTILYSSRQYWHNPYKENEIRAFLETLNDMQRVAFMFVGDLWTLAKYNDDFVRTMLRRLKDIPETNRSLDLNELLGKIEDEVLHASIQILSDQMKGQKLKELPGTDLGYQLATVIQNFLDTLDDYSDYIKAFLVTVNVPASLSYFPQSIRHSALMSDTDSTLFTVEHWNEWYFGELRFDNEASGIVAVTSFFSLANLKHLLALMSTNFGVAKDRLFEIAMKNEFRFEPFIPTLKTKHYYSTIVYQEGEVWLNPKLEIKGVHLKSSRSPVDIVRETKEFIEHVCDTIRSGKKLKLTQILNQMSERERDIIQDAMAGGCKYYKTGQVKNPDSYQQDEDTSPYRHYAFWNNTFGVKYGEAPPPPYTCFKLPVITDNKSRTKKWLDEMVDRDLASRINSELNRLGKDDTGTWFVPMEVIKLRKMPPELLEIVDTKKLIADTCSSFYFVLETLGIFRLNKKKTRLLHEEFFHVDDEGNVGLAEDYIGPDKVKEAA